MKACFILPCLVFMYSFFSKPAVRAGIDPKQIDTTFIERVICDSGYEGTPYHFYHAIFIEQNRKSEYYKDLSDFSFSKFENLDDANNVLRKKKIRLKKFNTLGLPKEWLPLNLYKGKYYLYAPSDWGNLGRRIICDSSLIFWFMDGPTPYAFQSIKKYNDTTYSLRTRNYLYACEGCVSPEILNIYIIDKKNKIAVWEYKSEKEKNYTYCLYVSKENIKKFDIIVNYCKTDKQMEVDFEEPDFARLLKNFPRK